MKFFQLDQEWEAEIDNELEKMDDGSAYTNKRSKEVKRELMDSHRRNIEDTSILAVLMNRQESNSEK